MIRALAIAALLTATVVAHADTPPSRTLERAIKLYDKTDYLSASIELAKVVAGETGDDEANKQRAQFYAAKVSFQLGFHVAAVAEFAVIARDPAHAYRLAALKWFAAALDKFDGLRIGLDTLTPVDTDDPSLTSVADTLRWFGGLGALDAHNAPGARAFFERVSPASRFHAAAEAELAWQELDTARARNDKQPHAAASDKLFAIASGADRVRARDAIHRLAAWASYLALDPSTRPGLDSVRSQLGELVKRDDAAAFAVSRLALLDRKEMSPLGLVDPEVLEAAAIGATCNQTDLATTSRAARARIGVLVGPEAADLDTRIAHDGPPIATLVATREIREARAWHVEATAELALIYRADKAWQTTRVAAELLQELTVEASISEQNTGQLESGVLKSAEAALEVLEHMIGPLGPIAVGPTIAPGRGLVARCGAGPIAVAPTVPEGPTRPPIVEPHRGCGGCASGGDAGLALGLLAVRRRRAARAR